MNIIGRLTKDAKVSTLKDDRQVVNFSVAVNDGYRNRQGEWVEQTEYFECSYWVSTKVAKLLAKGTLVELSGRASARVWLDGSGQARAGLNFHTSQIRLLAKRGAAEGAQNVKTVALQETADDADDLPF